MSALEIKNVSKTFKDTKALDNVSVRIEENKIYGLLGRNGAGKTTLLNIINNRLYPDQGSVTLDGQDVSENDQILKQFYLIGEKNLFPDTIKVKDAFKWSGEFFPNFDIVCAKAF